MPTTIWATGEALLGRLTIKGSAIVGLVTLCGFLVNSASFGPSGADSGRKFPTREASDSKGCKPESKPPSQPASVGSPGSDPREVRNTGRMPLARQNRQCECRPGSAQLRIGNRPL